MVKKNLYTFVNFTFLFYCYYEHNAYCMYVLSEIKRLIDTFSERTTTEAKNEGQDPHPVYPPEPCGEGGCGGEGGEE